MAKTAAQDDEKVNFLKQDFNMQNLMAVFKKKKVKEIEEVDENDNTGKALSAGIVNFNPTPPEVNLLPQSVVAEAEAARTSKKYSKVAIVVGVVFAAVFTAGTVGEQAAGMQAGSIEEEAQTLTAQASALAPYYQYGQSVDAKRSELLTSTQGEVDYPEISRQFQSIASSSGFQLTSASFAGSGGITAGGGEAVAADSATAPSAGGGGACVNPDPFSTETGAGCLSFTVEGDRSNLLDFYDNVASSDNFLNLYFAQSLIGGEEEDGALTGTVEYRDSFTTQNNFELADPVVPGLVPDVALPDAGTAPVAEPGTEG